MKLLVISHTPHYMKDGKPAGWGATVRELDQLAGLFESVTHIAPLHAGAASPGSAVYQASNIRLRAVPPSGGRGVFKKLGIFFRLPGYIAVILEELKKCDAVHVRCPANISLAAVIILSLVRFPGKRWIKYAGNWRPEKRETLSYAFQRWWLEKNFSRSRVSVNGEWPGQPAHVLSFFNPCLTARELETARAAVLEKKLSGPVRLVFAGRLEAEKGAGTALRVLAQLQKRGLDAVMELIGDGPGRGEFEALARDLGVAEKAVFHGELSRKDLSVFYAGAHFVILASLTEGWPKVLSEAMAYGAVPLSTAVSCIPQYLERFKSGKAFSGGAEQAFAEAVSDYCRAPEKWKEESLNAIGAARHFTYEVYLESVRKIFQI